MRRILSVLLAAAACMAADDPIAATRDRLRVAFDRRVADIGAYQREVTHECARFPEGDLFPYVLPALAYANAAVDGDGEARDRMRPLLDHLRSAIGAKVGAPGDDLARIEDYGRQATYLGETALAFGAWRLAGGDERYDEPRRAMCAALRRALAAAHGGQLASFPTYAWTFDTVPCCLALRLDDLADATDRSCALVRAHLAWMQEHLDPATHLPPSELATPDHPQKPPRGCDLSLRIALLAQLEPAQAATLYERYAAAFWRSDTLLCGFAEYPAGTSGQSDADSGPIIGGIGLSATGFGLATTLACDDDRRHRALAAHLAGLPVMRRAFAPALSAQSAALGGRPLDERYETGFLYGDACLLYAATWTRWPTARLPAP